MAEPDTARDTILYVGEMSVLSSSGEQAPSLLWRNQNGNIALHPHSGNLSIGIVKPATRPHRWFDYDFGIVLTGRISGTRQNIATPEIKGTGYFRELYAHVRLYIVDITAGIHPVQYGPGDSELGSGSLLFSNNIHPIPRITIGFDRWTPIPGLFGYVEVKGCLTHGWLADNNPYVAKTLLHHKFLGLRLGGKLPVNLSYEYHHAAQWGGYGEGHIDYGNDFASFKNVFLGRRGGATISDQLNAQGNHIISQTLNLTIKGTGWHVDMYWQDLQEDGGFKIIGSRVNSKDGRWGISAIQDRWPFISGATFEVIQTTDQSGPWHDRDGMVFGGRDNYYGNGSYKQGWTYYGRTIGSALMTPSNNRIWAYHAGIKGDIYGFKYRALFTYADNYGTYLSPTATHNSALMLEVKKHVEQAWGMDFGVRLAADFGSQFGNRFGAMVTISKRGIIHSY